MYSWGEVITITTMTGFAVATVTVFLVRLAGCH